MTETIFVSIAVLLRIVTNPLANVYQKQLALKGINTLFINFLTYFALSVFCVILLFFSNIPKPGSDFWIYAIMGGMAGALGNNFLIKALQRGDLSVLGPVNAYKSVVGIIVGIFLLSEIPDIRGISGILLIIWGSYFVLETTDERFTWKLFKNPAIQFRIWAMILTAVEAVFVKKVILASSTFLAFSGWCIFGAFFSFLLLSVYRVRVKKELHNAVNRIYLGKFALLVACVGTMQYTTNYVLEHMPVGYALSLFQLSIIVSIFLGYKIFREKEIGKKMVGSVIMLAGSVLIIWMKFP